VVFFNYGVDTGSEWKSAPFHEPILWRHVSSIRQSPDLELKELYAIDDELALPVRIDEGVL
jgi:hypothetical protein